jgi:hypothetical protein
MTTNGHAVIDEFFEVVLSIRFAPTYKAGTRNYFEISVQLFSRMRIQKAVQKLSVQLWSVNQRTTEAEEVTDSINRIKSVTQKTWHSQSSNEWCET